MSSLRILPALLAVLVVSSASTHDGDDDDFNFEVSDDFEVELGPRDGLQNKPLKLKDVTATVGRVFHLVVPVEAFGKNVKSYEAKRRGGKLLPSWLLFDKTGGVFWGVPTVDDVGVLHISIKSHSSDSQVASDEFRLTVKEDGEEADGSDKCPLGEDDTVLTLLINKGIKSIKPKQRVVAINNVAKFFGLPYSAFTLVPQDKPDDINEKSVILAGPGNVPSQTFQQVSLMKVTVGCDGRLWLQTAPMIHQLKQQARDGTISEVMRLPLIGWRVKTEPHSEIRIRRDVEDYGSGDYDEYYDEYEEEYDDDLGGGDAKTNLDLPASTTRLITPSSTTLHTTPSISSETHPHRHHHGEYKPIEEVDTSLSISREQFNIPVSSTEFERHYSQSTLPMSPTTVVTEKHTEGTTTEKETTSTTTTTTTTSTTTTTTTTTTEAPVTDLEINTIPFVAKDVDDDYGDYDDEDDEESETIVPDFTTKGKITETDTITETTMLETAPPTIPYKVTNAVTPPPSILTEVPSTTVREIPITEPATTSVNTTTSSATTVSSASTTTVEMTTNYTIPPTTIPEKMKTTEEEVTTIKQTTPRHVTSTPKMTTTQQVTEIIEYDTKNFPPIIQHRLQRIPITAGKVFSYYIPPDTFTDIEDGNDLKLEFLDSDGNAIKKTSWCQFNPVTKEIYGLPLDEDVSRWEYLIVATDKENASVTDRLEILVQQHKAKRVVNHEFSLYIRIENHKEFPHSIDWSLKTLHAISALYRSNINDITVRSVNYTSDPVIFTWTNDSLPTNYCPKSDIERLFNILTANDRGDPSLSLSHALAPELRVKKVVYQGLGVCEPQWQTPVTPPVNFSPILRNPVDHINATVGELLLFRVPDDTFYDPEDVDARTLNVSLLTADRQPISSDNWLQFDSINKEFYGVPRKAGRNEYQLVCRDSGGLTAVDSLEVVVYPAPKVYYNLEISMTLETSYDAFAYSANMQRKFIEKLKDLFGDRNTSYIHLNHPKELRQGGLSNTVVTWYNKSLDSEKCPFEEINRIESVLKNNDRTVASRVHSIMDPDFPVSTIKFKTSENCRSKPKYKPDVVDVVIPVADETQSTNSEEYLITFIVPAVIIAVMLLLAGVAACVLYRRRRTGKMNVEEDGKQSYGNKGIPVIFQEELDEKPESGTKAPVILKDEKPPLAPPEYSKSGSLKLNDDSEPYQPPPPFTRTQDNNRQSRPKPTPTYRKPPPYVPP